MAKMNKLVPTMKPIGTRANKAIEKTPITAKPKPSAESVKIKITRGSSSTSGGPKSKAVVSGGKSMTSTTKITKQKPMTEAQKQAKALAGLEAKRAAVAKKTGKRPNYGTN